MKKKITYAQMLELNTQANYWLLKNGFLELDKSKTSLTYTTKEMTKLASGLKNIIKQIGKLLPDHTEQVDAMREKHALSDPETKALLYEEDGKTHKFSAEGKDAFRKELKKFNAKETVEIHTRIQEDEKVDLDDFETFAGIVVPEVKEKK